MSTTPSPGASAIGSDLRTAVRRGEMHPVEAARRLKFLGQDVEGSLDLLLDAYERTEDVALLESIGDLYVSAGQRVAAESLFRRLYYEGFPLHVTNLIYAGVPATQALVDDERQILFIPLPKCGSSTVKNYFTAAIHGQGYGEMVHFKHPELYRTVTQEDLRTRYRTYFRFSVVRDPIGRLASYFTRNIGSNSLTREAVMQTEFLGFPTRPGPAKMAFWFHQYRQFFKDFRHHTDLICGYLDPFRDDLDKIYGMADLPEIRERLSDSYGVTLEDTRSMVSKSDDTEKEKIRNALRMLENWYAEDYERYM